MNPDIKHNLVNVAIIATPLIVVMITYILSGAPFERSSLLAFTFLIGSMLSALFAAFVTTDRKWK